MSLSLKIDDPSVIEALREKPDGVEREAFANAALRIGVIALRHVNTSVDVEKLKSEGERLVENLQREVAHHREVVEKSVGDSLAKYLDPKGGEFNRRIESLVNEDGGELTRLIEKQLVGENSRLAKLLAQQVGEESPLVQQLDPESKTGAIASIEAAVAKLLEDQRKIVLEQFDLNTEDSAINRLLKGVKQLNQEVGEHFDLNSDSSALSRLSGMLEETKKQIRKELTLDDEQSALFLLRSTLSSQMEDLIEKQVAFEKRVGEALAAMTSRKEEARRGTQHGREFEHEVADALESRRGNDLLSHVGEDAGALRNSKVGDLVLTLSNESVAPGEKIVIEAKQHGAYARIDKAIEEAGVACINREAQLCVFVMSGRTVDSWNDKGSLNDWRTPLERHGNAILCVWHPEKPETDAILEAALSLARALVVRMTQGNDSQADWGKIDAAMSEIDKQVSRFGDVEKSCTTIENSVGKIRDELRKIGNNLTRQSERLTDEIELLRE